MEATKVEFVGASCGQHGPYTFYKAFKYHKDGKTKILSLGEFFFVEILKDAPVSIGELQLIWEDKNNNQLLASVRLYFLPEHTPDGKQEYHGEDEILALSEKLILRLDDLVSLITDQCPYWTAGRVLVCEKDIKKKQNNNNSSLLRAFQTNNSGLQLGDINKEKEMIGETEKTDDAVKVIVMSFAQYCRYRSIMKRLEHVQDKWLKHTIVRAIGGVISPTHNCHVMFCRDTFFHPELEEFELRCDHFAPNLKGRPRKKKSARKGSAQDSDSYEEESDSSMYMAPGGMMMSSSAISLAKQRTRRESCRNGIRWNRNTTREEQHFLASLHKFMRNRQTPIDRVPNLGFKQINLYLFYVNAKKLGGYEEITKKRLWKSLYDMMGGHASSTSAATCTRRHYERLLLPFERHETGETHKPFPSSMKKKPSFVRALMPKDPNNTENDRNETQSKVKEKLEIKVKQDVKAKQDIKQKLKDQDDMKANLDPKPDLGRTKRLISNSKPLSDPCVEDKERKWNEIRKKCALQRDKLKKITNRNTVKKMLDRVSSGEDDKKEKEDKESDTDKKQVDENKVHLVEQEVVSVSSVLVNSGHVTADPVRVEVDRTSGQDVPCVKQRMKPSIMSPLIQRRGLQKVAKTQEQHSASRTLPSVYYASQLQLAAPGFLEHSVLASHTNSGIVSGNSLFGDQTVVSVSNSTNNSHINSVFPNRSRPSVIQPNPKVKAAPFVGSQLFQNPSAETVSPNLKPAHSNSSKRAYPYLDIPPPPSHLQPSQAFSKLQTPTSKTVSVYTNNVFLAPDSKRSRYDETANNLHHHNNSNNNSNINNNNNNNNSIQDEPIDLSVKTNNIKSESRGKLGYSVSPQSASIPFNLSTSSFESMPYTLDLTNHRAATVDFSSPSKDVAKSRSSSVTPTSHFDAVTSHTSSRSDVTKVKSQDPPSASSCLPTQRSASAAPLTYTKTSKSSTSSSSTSSSSTYQDLSTNVHPAFPSSAFMPQNVVVNSPLQIQQFYAAHFSNVHPSATYEEIVRQQLHAHLNSGAAIATAPMQIYPHLYKESQKSGASK